MSDNEALNLPKTQKREEVNLTVREVIARLAMCEDMDAEVCFSIANSDPIPATDVTDNGDGQVIITA